MFKKGLGWVILLLVFFSLIGGIPAQAQTADPTDTVTPTITATPEPTQPPAILFIEPTPLPTPPPTGNLLEQVWDEYKLQIAFAIVTSIIIGVFLKQIAEGLSKRISRLLNALFAPFASAPVIHWRYQKRYRDKLAEVVQELAASKIVDRPIELDKVYVPVGLTQETQPVDQTTFESHIQWLDDIRRKQREKAVPPWDAVRDYHKLVVLGEPGAGKTTYLAHLAFMCAQQKRLKQYTPIFIRLRDLKKVDRLEDAFPEFFEDHCFPNAGRFLQGRLKAGRCLVLLDGLDEVPDQERYGEIVQLVQKFANRYTRDGENGREEGNIVVVSSRTYSYRHGVTLDRFTETLVMDFDDANIERFVFNWFTKVDLRPLAEKMLSTLRNNPRFLELARNPLLLLLISHHYEREYHLPSRRTGLYERCIRTRITVWNTRRLTHQGHFDETEKWRMLRALAFYLYEQDQRGLLNKNALIAWLEPYAARLPDQTTAIDLLDEVVRTSGLIQEWTIGYYGFSHQTLQEYFAAEAIKDLGPDKGAAILEPHFESSSWQEVIKLYCGLTTNADPLLRRIIRQAQNKPEEKTLWLLAGHCLEEGASNVASELVEQIVEKLFGLLRTTDGRDEVQLTPKEGVAVVRQLQTLAGDNVPGLARTLLDSSTSSDVLLAARLLPEGLDPDLSSEISQRVTELARSGEDEERRAASVALGWVGEASDEAVAALLVGLNAQEASARADAARALGRMGAKEENVFVALQNLYNTDPEDAPRHAALGALLALGQAKAVGMALIPAGEFLMGSTDNDKDSDSDEKPQHSLYLPEYYMDITPVTNAQYRRFMEAGGYQNPDYWQVAIEAEHWQDGAYVYGSNKYTQPRYWDDDKWNQPNHPVVGVSWYEALAYARWAGKRLPTEAEWEKAARGTDGRIYVWGDEPPTAQHCNFNQKIKATTPVGQYPLDTSPYGLVDVAGNVNEWCSTRWGHDYPYDPNDGREDLSGGDNVSRVFRGGAWDDGKKLVRCAFRGWNSWDWDDVGGFRCCSATASLTTERPAGA